MIPEIDCVDGGIVPYMGQNLKLRIQYEEGLGFAGIRLKDGETIGFSENDRHTIALSEGVALPGMTLKVSYES